MESKKVSIINLVKKKKLIINDRPKKEIIKIKRNFIKCYFILISLIIILVFIPAFISENIRKASEIYEINYKIEGKSYQVILGENAPTPNEIIINGETKIDLNVLYDFTEYENYITIKWTQMPSSCSKMFKNCGSIVSIDLSKFDSSLIIDVSEMFSGCIQLEYINFTNFDVTLVENMDKMFYDCINLISLDLSNFYTISAYSMEGMFQNTESLISLDLKNFDTSKVTNMKNMFNNCKSLIYINLQSFIEKEDVLIENIFTSQIEHLIYCINVNKAPNIFSELYSNNLENDCENICFTEEKKIDIDDKICVENCQDEKYEYELNNICYKKTSVNENTEISKYSANTNLDSILNDKYTENINFSFETIFKESKEKSSEESTNIDEIIKSLKEFIISDNSDLVFSNLISGNKQDLIAEYKNVTYQITTTENQKYSNYSNISSINLGDCEDKLKEIYGINPNLSLIILKIDYNLPYFLIPLIGYEVYHPINKSQLDLNYCNETLVKVNIPVTIDEDKIYKYDPSSDYYNDECYAYETENGTDIILNDRKEEFVNNNYSLCEHNCTFKGYDSNTKKALCECEIKINIISDILNDKNILSNDFNSTENSNLNIGTLKCVSLLFSKIGLLNNIGSYILIFNIFFFGISVILFFKCGYYLIQNKIEEIIEFKKGKKNNIDIFNLKQNQNGNKKKKKKNEISSNPNKKNMRKINKLNKEKEKDQNLISLSKSELKNTNVILINNQRHHKNNGNIIIHKDNKIKSNDSNIQKITIKEFEMNSFSFIEALELDKRTYLQYYFSLIKTKIHILFSFYPIDDYNVKIIKICLFFLFFSIFFAVNTFFFNDKTLHQIYKDGGKYNFRYFFPQIIYSFIICYIITSIIKYFSLSERNVLEIKREEDPNKINAKVEKTKKCLIIKYIIFFIVSFVLLILFWFYLSSFCAVYQNTQVYIIINTFISFGICIIYSIIFNLIPSIFRIISLKDNSSRNLVFFNISKILQIL